MATILVYNGVRLKVIKVKTCTALPVNSKDGADYLYTRFRLEVTGLVNQYFHSWTGAGAESAGQPPFVSTFRLQQWLLAKRRNLTFAVHSLADATNWANCAPFKTPGVQFDVLAETYDARYPAKCDPDNGPTPLYCTITRVDNEGAVMVDYGIEFCSRLANITTMAEADTPAGWPVLQSNRWSMAEEVTEDYMAVRLIQGVAEFRPDALLAQTLDADSIRRELMHPIPDGMRREKIRVVADSDGKTINYSFVDRQLILPGGPRFPFTKPEIHFNVVGGFSNAGNGGASLDCAKTFSMRGTGPPNVTRWDMLVCAVRMALQHISGAGPGAGNDPVGFVMYTHFDVTYLKHLNYINLTVSARFTPPAEGIVDENSNIPGGLMVNGSGLKADEDIFAVNASLSSIPGNLPLSRALAPREDCRALASSYLPNIGHLVTAALKGENDRLSRPRPYGPGGSGRGGGNG